MLPSKTFGQVPTAPCTNAMLRPKRCVEFVLFASICSAALMGCAAPRADPARLAQTPAELQALQAMQAENPALMKDPEMMEIALQSFRAGQARRQALAIELRHQYPTLTPAELLTLIDDRMARESDAMLNTAMPARVDCQSMRLGAFVNTSCY